MEAEDPLLNIPRPLAQVLRPHQLSALQFLWKKLITNGLKTQQEHNGSSSRVYGAVLGHSMGLGKTLTTLVFLQMVQEYMKHIVVEKEKNVARKSLTITCPFIKILVIAPRSVVDHWQQSSTSWLTPSYLGNASRPLPVHITDGTNSDTRSILHKFYAEGGLLVLGYEEYLRVVKEAREWPKVLDGINPVRSLLTATGYKGKYSYSSYILRRIDPEKLRGKVCSIEILEDVDFVVFDEAHRLKKAKSALVQNLSHHLRQIPLRLALTGTPLQNHLQDYNVMLSVVNGSAVDRKQFANLFIKPVERGQCVDSSYHQFLEMQRCVASLRRFFSEFVHHCGPDVLAQYLPPRKEFLFFFELSATQEECYKKVLDELVKRDTDGKALVVHHNCSHICIHPCFAGQGKYRLSAHAAIPQSGEDDIDNDNDPTSLDLSAEQNLFEKSMPGAITTLKSIAESPKLFFALQLVQHIVKDRKEKVVVFSHYIPHLMLFKELLEEFYKTRANIFWGSSTATQRSALVSEFNTDPNCSVLLCSVVAGGVGIDLSAANHCILLDVSWNPADDSQATYRIYRFGQKKTVYIYRLACLGTTEHVVFAYSLQKTWLQRKIVDVMDPSRQEQHLTKNYYIYPAQIPIAGMQSFKTKTERKECIEQECRNTCPPVAELLERDKGLLNNIAHFIQHSFLLSDNEDEVVQEIGKRFEVERQKSSLLSKNVSSTEGPPPMALAWENKETAPKRRREKKLLALAREAVEHLISYLGSEENVRKLFLLPKLKPQDGEVERLFLDTFQSYVQVFNESVLNSPPFSHIKSKLLSEVSSSSSFEGNTTLLLALQFAPFRLLRNFHPTEQTYIATELGCVRPLVIHLLVESIKTLFTRARYEGRDLACLDALNSAFNVPDEEDATPDKLEVAVKSIERCYDLLWPQYEGFKLPRIPFDIDEELDILEECFSASENYHSKGVLSLHEISLEMDIEVHDDGAHMAAMCRRCNRSELKRTDDVAFICPRCFYNLETDVRNSPQFLHRVTLYQLNRIQVMLTSLDIDSTFFESERGYSSVYELLVQSKRSPRKKSFPIIKDCLENGVTVLLSDFEEHTVRILGIQCGVGSDVGELQEVLIANSYFFWEAMLRRHLKRKISETFRERVAHSKTLSPFSGMPLIFLVLSLLFRCEQAEVSMASELLRVEFASLDLLRHISDAVVNLIYLRKLITLSKAYPGRNSATPSSFETSSNDETTAKDVVSDAGVLKRRRPVSDYGSNTSNESESQSQSESEVSSFHLTSSSGQVSPVLSHSSSRTSISSLEEDTVSEDEVNNPPKTTQSLDTKKIEVYWLAFEEVYGVGAILENEAVKQRYFQSGLNLHRLESHYSNGKTVLQCVELFIEGIIDLSKNVRVIFD